MRKTFYRVIGDGKHRCCDKAKTWLNRDGWWSSAGFMHLPTKSAAIRSFKKLKKNKGAQIDVYPKGRKAYVLMWK